MQKPRKIVIVGGGIAGLCSAVYARKCGYEVELLEMHDRPGGLATNWRRGDYTFETCLHWLLGSNPNRAMHSEWQEVFDIDRLTFLNPEEYARVENGHGESLRIYSDVDRLEAELLARAPEDAAEIRAFTSAIRELSHFEFPDPSEARSRFWLKLLRAVPELPTIQRWSRLSIGEYGLRFHNPLLRAFFSGGENGDLSALALVLSLAWMSDHNAGYPIGGSQAVVRLIVDKLRQLGGHLRFGAKVERILVENDAAVGVQLTNGETIAADWVISAADGHSTIYDLLGGKYRNRATDKTYETFKTFPSYVQVSLGVARDLSEQGRFVLRLLDAPLIVDPGTSLKQLALRFFHFDPTFAPAGKTAVTCFLPTRHYEYWVNLERNEPAEYKAEKQRIAAEVIGILEASIPGLRAKIEVVDVSTPVSVIRYTGNWKGSMEGWLLTPETGCQGLPKTLPGLRNFVMAGQWVMPGGGFPSGLITARGALREICSHDGVAFETRELAAAL